MTVIACNQDMMAADTETTDGGIKGREKKIFRINGDIVGTAGSSEEGLKAMAWYRDKTIDKPSLDSDFVMLVLKPDGKILVYESGLIPQPPNPHWCYAIGFAAAGAMCAMRAGATPQAAVKICGEVYNQISGLTVLRR